MFFGEEEFIIGRYKDDTKTIIEVGITEEDCIIVGERIETIYSKDKIIKFPCKTEIDFHLTHSSSQIIDSLKFNVLYLTRLEFFIY